MLETPEERVKLLKAGITGKTIEKLYVIYNNFKVVRNPALFELIEIDLLRNNKSAINREVAAKAGNRLNKIYMC